MLVVASNITTRDPKIERILRKVDLKATRNEIQKLACRCAAAGADVLNLNLQQHHDRPDVMAFLVGAAQEATGRRLCLSTGNAVILLKRKVK